MKSAVKYFDQQGLQTDETRSVAGGESA